MAAPAPAAAPAKARTIAPPSVGPPGGSSAETTGGGWYANGASVAVKCWASSEMESGAVGASASEADRTRTLSTQ